MSAHVKYRCVADAHCLWQLSCTNDQHTACPAQAHLHVLVWVPVTVIDDDCVGRSEVDAQATSARRQQENKAVRVVIELLDLMHADLVVHAAIDAV